MSDVVSYSERLGAISRDQFQAVADRLALGQFLDAEPISSGLFGQNVFMTTSVGAFVLRGAPHWVKALQEDDFHRDDRIQFSQERFFAEQLHRRTRTPVPWPMLHDETSDIFGWPYLVMPRMPGECFDEHSIRAALGEDDRRGVAQALGAMLAEMQQLSWPFAGAFDVYTNALTPFEGGAVQRIIDETRRAAQVAEQHGALLAADFAWIESAAKRARAAQGMRPNTFTHCDFKLNNLTVSRGSAGWSVTGVFDLHEACFADGALDVVRQACAWLDTEPALAREFIAAYRAAAPMDDSLAERLPLYVARDRITIWSYFVKQDRPAWARGTTFHEWAQRYSSALCALI